MADDGQILFTGMAILLVVGGLIPLIITSFEDITTYDINPVTQQFVPFIETIINYLSTISGIGELISSAFNGLINWATFGFWYIVNPPSNIEGRIAGEGLFLGVIPSDFLLSYIYAFTYIPLYISLPLLVLSFSLIGYGLIKLAQGFIP